MYKKELVYNSGEAYGVKRQTVNLESCQCKSDLLSNHNHYNNMSKTPTTTTTTTYATTGQLGPSGQTGQSGYVGVVGYPGVTGSSSACTYTVGTTYSSTISTSGSIYNFYIAPVEIRFGFTLKFKNNKAKLVRLLNEGQKLSFEPTHDLKQIL